MNLQQLIETFPFLGLISMESKQCARYVVNLSNSNSGCLKDITQKVFQFPSNGSNSFIGKHFDYQNPSYVYKMYRLQLSDYSELADDDIELRVKELFDLINNYIEKHENKS